MTDVSIIIVSWNAKDYLQKCLESVKRCKTAFKVETIVVDNASDDGSPEMVLRKFPQVRLVQTGTNLGFARGNNIGMQHAQGRYLCLINSDVELMDETIDVLVRSMDRQRRIGMIGPLIYGGDGKVQESVRDLPSLRSTLARCLASDGVWLRKGDQKACASDEPVAVQVLSGCFWLVRTKAVQKVKGLDEGYFMYAEDVDWCLRFRSAGWQVALEAKARAIHYGGASSANAPIRFAVEMQKADLRYWRKNHSITQATGYFLITSIHHLLRILGYGLAGALGASEERRYKIRRAGRCLYWLWTSGVQLLAGDRPKLQTSYPAPIDIRGNAGPDPRPESALC